MSSTNNKSILVIGDAYVETQYFVSTIPSANQFEIATNAQTVYGSKTINSSRIFARLRDKTTFFTNVGDDLDGVNVVQAISDWGIFAHIEKITGSKTGKISVITNQNGESSITLYPGANATITPKVISTLKEKILLSDAIYTGTHLPLEALYCLADICHENGKILFVDVPNQHSQLDLSKLSDLNFFVPNRQEAELLTTTKIISVQDAFAAILLLRKYIKGLIIITLDKEGCVFLNVDSNKPKHIPTIPLKAVDETGAGDIFRAILLHHILKSEPIETAIQKALVTATESVKIKGVDNTLQNLNLE